MILSLKDPHVLNLALMENMGKPWTERVSYVRKHVKHVLEAAKVIAFHVVILFIWIQDYVSRNVLRESGADYMIDIASIVMEFVQLALKMPRYATLVKHRGF
jgi:hypothetical protein